MIDLDEQTTIEFSPEMVKKITRPRAIKILKMIAEAREVIIDTHPEPDTLRLTINSDWFTKLVEAQPEVIDPNGTIRFLQKLDALFVELGLDDEPGIEDPNAIELPPGDDEEEGDGGAF